MDEGLELQDIYMYNILILKIKSHLYLDIFSASPNRGRIEYSGYPPLKIDMYLVVKMIIFYFSFDVNNRVKIINKLTKYIYFH